MSFSLARHMLKASLPRSSRVFGWGFPDPGRTRSDFLRAVGESIYVVKDQKAAVITRSGVIRVGRTFLDVDYGPYSAFRTMGAPRGKGTFYPKIVSLWTHDWTTYYHWLIDVAPKIAAAKLHFGSEIGNVTFAYPRPLLNYELDTFEMLGVPSTNVVNTHLVGEMVSPEIFVLPLPGWINISPRIFKLIQFLNAPSRPLRRLYVARRGRRSITNEEQLFQALQTYGFEFISDIPRPLSQQIELFSSASHIVAPHGAALSNIVWMGRHTKVLELASSSYAPDYFVKLASMLDIHLKKLTFGNSQSHWTNGSINFSADVSLVQKAIESRWEL